MAPAVRITLKTVFSALVQALRVDPVAHGGKCRILHIARNRYKAGKLWIAVGKTFDDRHQRLVSGSFSGIYCCRVGRKDRIAESVMVDHQKIPDLCHFFIERLVAGTYPAPAVFFAAKEFQVFLNVFHAAVDIHFVHPCTQACRMAQAAVGCNALDIVFGTGSSFGFAVNTVIDRAGIQQFQIALQKLLHVFFVGQSVTQESIETHALNGDLFSFVAIIDNRIKGRAAAENSAVSIMGKACQLSFGRNEETPEGIAAYTRFAVNDQLDLVASALILDLVRRFNAGAGKLFKRILLIIDQYIGACKVYIVNFQQCYSASQFFRRLGKRNIHFRHKVIEICQIAFGFFRNGDQRFSAGFAIGFYAPLPHADGQLAGGKAVAGNFEFKAFAAGNFLQNQGVFFAAGYSAPYQNGISCCHAAVFRHQGIGRTGCGDQLDFSGNCVGGINGMIITRCGGEKCTGIFVA